MLATFFSPSPWPRIPSLSPWPPQPDGSTAPARAAAWGSVTAPLGEGRAGLSTLLSGWRRWCPAPGRPLLAYHGLLAPHAAWRAASVGHRRPGTPSPGPPGVCVRADDPGLSFSAASSRSTSSSVRTVPAHAASSAPSPSPTRCGGCWRHSASPPSRPRASPSAPARNRLAPPSRRAPWRAGPALPGGPADPGPAPALRPASATVADPRWSALHFPHSRHSARRGPGAQGGARKTCFAAPSFSRATTRSRSS